MRNCRLNNNKNQPKKVNKKEQNLNKMIIINKQIEEKNNIISNIRN